MRKALDSLYAASGVLGALFIVAIAVAVLAQVGANAVDVLLALTTGSPAGLVVPSYAEFTGFFLAASSFLALAYTLRHGAHIRVTLAITRLPPAVLRWVEVWCCLVGAAASGFFTLYTALLVMESYEFGDLSPGMIPVPLWLPQMSMAVGLAVLTIALLDDMVAALRGRQPSYEQGGPDVSSE